MKQPFLKILKPPADLFLTLFFWLYFIAGFLLFYLPAMLALFLLADNREMAIQKLNHSLFRAFFWALDAFIPGLSIIISNDVKKIKSSVVIANHCSYLDAILLIAIFPMHKTIVKEIFFQVPIMKRAMKSGGYIPFAPGGKYNDRMAESITGISDFIKKGGNLFIFPEGKRSRDGIINKFQKGAFSIAARSGAPLQMLYIRNTDRLFSPGRFLLNTCIANAISVEKLGSIEPSSVPVREMRDAAEIYYKNRTKEGKGTSNN